MPVPMAEVGFSRRTVQRGQTIQLLDFLFERFQLAFRIALHRLDIRKKFLLHLLRNADFNLNPAVEHCRGSPNPL